MTIIATIYGDMDESDLVKTEGSLENENEITSWVEYRKPGSDEIVHRSVHMILKKLPVNTGVETGRI